MQLNNLIEHPEGGRFQEVFRSPISVASSSGEARAALTHIYFELQAHEHSAFHQVTNDEIWNLYEGQGIYLYVWDGSTTPPEKIEISPAARSYCHVVPANFWQAAVPIQTTTLVGCSVAPGFEFADFKLIEDAPTVLERLLLIAPDLKSLAYPAKSAK